MITNEQVSILINEYIKEIENHLNTIELECKKENPNIGTISICSGKIAKIFSLLAFFLGTYDGMPKNTGGFREMFALEKEKASKK
jgi:hypothetical protein